jgi:pantothenate synthetase
LAAAREIIDGENVKIDYLSIAAALDLKPLAETIPLGGVAEPRIFAAVRVGTTRLIDNMALD